MGILCVSFFLSSSHRAEPTFSYFPIPIFIDKALIKIKEQAKPVVDWLLLARFLYLIFAHNNNSTCSFIVVSLSTSRQKRACLPEWAVSKYFVYWVQHASQKYLGVCVWTIYCQYQVLTGRVNPWNGIFVARCLVKGPYLQAIFSIKSRLKTLSHNSIGKSILKFRYFNK